MLSTTMLNNSIQEMKNLTGFDYALWDMEENCQYATSEEMVHSLTGAECHPVKEDGNQVYTFAIKGEGEGIHIAGVMGVKQIETLLLLTKEKMSRSHFIQNLLLDNMLLVDVYNQAKRLGIQIEAKRVVLLVESKKPDDGIIQEFLRSTFAAGTRDFVTAIDEKRVIFIKHVESTEGYKDLEDLARTIVSVINTEAMVAVRVSFGTIVEELKDVSRSFKEAEMALEVGRVFYQDRNVFAYKELGIGRLIYQLPASLCEMFLQEVCDGDMDHMFTEEELFTVDAFFENNLNISETARQLYIHRNTLGYRLEKIQKKTGLDIRIFDDALTFKIALMVADHMRMMK